MRAKRAYRSNEPSFSLKVQAKILSLPPHSKLFHITAFLKMKQSFPSSPPDCELELLLPWCEPTVSPQSARPDQARNEGCQVQFKERGFLFSLVSSNASTGKTSQCHLPHYCYVVFRVIMLTVILTQAGICFVSALVIENYPKPSCCWD